MDIPEQPEVFFVKKSVPMTKRQTENEEDIHDNELQLIPSSENWTRRMSFT